MSSELNAVIEAVVVFSKVIPLHSSQSRVETKLTKHFLKKIK